MKKTRFQTKYNKLKQRIITIKKHFDFSPGINGLTSLQNDKVRSVLLLCHAEIESYIEYLALDLIDDARVKWRKNHVANYNLASLFIASVKIEATQSALTKSEKMIADYIQSVQTSNHGVKEHNIKSLFGPLGYDIDDFDSSFISTLNTFGSDRGRIAHTSAKQTSSMYDKETEYNRIDDIIKGLEDFQNVLLSKANAF